MQTPQLGDTIKTASGQGLTVFVFLWLTVAPWEGCVLREGIGSCEAQQFTRADMDRSLKKLNLGSWHKATCSREDGRGSVFNGSMCRSRGIDRGHHSSAAGDVGYISDLWVCKQLGIWKNMASFPVDQKSQLFSQGDKHGPVNLFLKLKTGTENNNFIPDFCVTQISAGANQTEYEGTPLSYGCLK